MIQYVIAGLVLGAIHAIVAGPGGDLSSGILNVAFGSIASFIRYLGAAAEGAA